MTPTFQGEVQMRRWSDSSTQGVQVTFALPDSADLDPLKGMEGKRFMAVLVLIGDDEQPAIPEPVKRRKDTRGPLCREACDYCVMPDFWKWLRVNGKPCDSESEARAWVLELCDVRSRKELDTIAGAGDYFVQIVRRPFMHWQRERRAAQ